jgi:hypothetical protein
MAMKVLYTEGFKFEVTLNDSDIIVARGGWTLFADARCYNSSAKKFAKPYVFKGKGRLTAAMLRKHAKKVIAHAAKQDACRFFEIYEVKKLVGPGRLVQMVFGS